MPFTSNEIDYSNPDTFVSGVLVIACEQHGMWNWTIPFYYRLTKYIYSKENTLDEYTWKLSWFMSYETNQFGRCASSIPIGSNVLHSTHFNWRHPSILKASKMLSKMCAIPMGCALQHDGFPELTSDQEPQWTKWEWALYPSVLVQAQDLFSCSYRKE